MPSMLATLLGLTLIGIVVRDVVHELFHPAGSGTLSRGLERLTWRAFHRFADGRAERLAMAGPTMLIAIVVTWSLLMVLGWALVYLPHLPGQFRFASPLDPGAESGFGTALYLSLVTLSTLGFGDITPTPLLLRIAFTLEAFLGFVIFTAGISWVLSARPVLANRRALATAIGGLHEAEQRTGATLDQLPFETLRPLLIAISERIAQVRVDFLQSPETYFFHPEDNEVSLARTLPYLHLRVRAIAAREDGAAFHAAVLEHGIRGLADVLGEQFLDMPGAPVHRVLRAYATDHLRTPLEGSRGSRDAAACGRSHAP
jgi:hypothetical protein